MAILGEIQVRNFFIVKTATNATITAVKAGIPLNGAIVKYDGAAAAAGEEFALVVKNNRNGITLSDTINPHRIKYVKSLAPVARVAKSVVVSDITVEAGELYRLAVILPEYGSLSVEDELIKEGYYKAKTGDTAENVVDGLIKSLSKALSRMPFGSEGHFSYTPAGGAAIQLPASQYFTLSKTGAGANATLTIAEKLTAVNDYYVVGRKDNLNMNFVVTPEFPELPTVTVTAGNPGIGTGHQVANMEYYYLGNRGDTFRGMGYPHNFVAKYDTDVTKNYHLIEIGYWDEGRDDPMKSKKQMTIACETEAVATALATSLNTALTNSGFAVDDFDD